MTILPREDPSRFVEELDREMADRRAAEFHRKFQELRFLPRKKKDRKRRRANEDSD